MLLGKKLRSVGDGLVMFHCPGCKTGHMITVARDPDFPGGPCWGYNDNPDAPTFTPSILVRSGHYSHGETPGDCYCDYSTRFPDREPIAGKCFRCHSFVTAGKIQFLDDCTHALKGQTVDLPDWENLNGEC